MSDFNGFPMFQREQQELKISRNNRNNWTRDKGRIEIIVGPHRDK
jgi:hypothetical protein